MTTPGQNKTIHTLRARIGSFTDGDYRDMLRRLFPNSFAEAEVSSRFLTSDQAARLIDELKKLAPGAAPPAGRRASQTASGRWAPILRALWISGYNLKLIDNRDDAAMIAFVERQTHIGHVQWLTDPREAAKAVEALKDWLRRGGVVWPERGDDVHTIAWLRKRAVLDAIARKIAELDPSFDLEDYAAGAVAHGRVDRLGEMEIDSLALQLGRKLRELRALRDQRDQRMKQKGAA